MDLREAWIGEERPALVGAPDGGCVGKLGVRRQVEDVAVASGGENDGVSGVDLNLSVDQIARHDSASAPVDHDHVQHLPAVVEPDLTGADLAAERLVRPQEKLLSGLAARVEGA